MSFEPCASPSRLRRRSGDRRTNSRRGGLWTAVPFDGDCVNAALDRPAPFHYFPVIHAIPIPQ